MRPVRSIAGSIVLALLAVGCDDSPSTAAADSAVDAQLSTAPDWGVVTKNDENGLLLSVWGRSANEVYFVGGRADGTAIAQWDGAQLSWINNPGAGLAWWVYGVDNQTFIVGDQGLGLQKTGDEPWAEWDTGVDKGILYGVWGPTADDLWVVGGDFQRDGPPRLRHWDGATWTDAELPDLTAESPKAFFKVWGTGPNDIHVAGDRGVMLHFDGQTWSKVTAPQVDAVLTVHGGAAGAWSVGGRATGSIWLHQEGAWVDRTPPDRLPGLAGVFADDAGHVLVSGYDGLVMERTLDGDWNTAKPLTTELLHSVWKSADGASWAAGGTFLRFPNTAEGVILHRAAP